MPILLKKKYEILVGFPKDKQVIYPPDDRKGHYNKGGQSVAEVARWNEFGTNTIPSRPFLRTALRKNKERIKNLILKAFSPKEISDPRRFDKIGLLIVAMVRDSIVNGNWKSNSERTKLNKLKYSTRKLVNSKDPNKQKIVQSELAKIKPLIDRGIMRQSVNYEVREI